MIVFEIIILTLLVLFAIAIIFGMGMLLGAHRMVKHLQEHPQELLAINEDVKSIKLPIKDFHVQLGAETPGDFRTEYLEISRRDNEHS